MSRLIIRNGIKNKTLCLDALEGSFDEVIKTVQDWKSKYESLCSDGEWCKLDLEYYGHDGCSELTVKYYHYETDEEYSARLSQEAKKLSETQEKEIAKLKALKEKYKDLEI